MSKILINKSLIECISNNCKQLVCIHLCNPLFDSNSVQIDFKEIGKLLDHKIEIEISSIFIEYMGEDSIIAMMQNMPQIKDITLYDDMCKYREIIPHFGPNIRYISILDIEKLEINDLKTIRNNTNLVELRLGYSGDNSQQIYDFIFDNFIELKSFHLECGYQMISLSKLTELINLESLKIIYSNLEFSSMAQNKNNLIHKLLSLKLVCVHSLTASTLTKFIQMFPNIERLTIMNPRIGCEHQIENTECFECMDEVIKCLSKMNGLKILEILDFNYQTIKAIANNINGQTFNTLEVLILHGDYTPDPKKSINCFLELIFDLILSLTQMCDRNIKKLFTFKMHPTFMKFITEKKLINGVKYNVFFDCKKFEENYGKKFEIPKNMRITNAVSKGLVTNYYMKNAIMTSRVYYLTYDRKLKLKV
jgi:hypothetical protein